MALVPSCGLPARATFLYAVWIGVWRLDATSLRYRFEIWGCGAPLANSARPARAERYRVALPKPPCGTSLRRAKSPQRGGAAFHASPMGKPGQQAERGWRLLGPAREPDPGIRIPRLPVMCPLGVNVALVVHDTALSKTVTHAFAVTALPKHREKQPRQKASSVHRGPTEQTCEPLVAKFRLAVRGMTPRRHVPPRTASPCFLSPLRCTPSRSRTSLGPDRSAPVAHHRHHQPFPA
jgi:hypothetical protein